MFAFTQRFASFIVLSFALQGAFAAVANIEIPSGKEFDLICSKAAKENGVANPQTWVWSAAEANCVQKSDDAGTDSGPGASTDLQDVDNGDSTDLDAADDSTSGQDDDNSLAARAPARRCAEGSLDKCLQDCSQFKPLGWKDGESGAWVGCRASCNFRCGVIKGGCWKNYCWASCATGFPLTERAEWCYTTKSYSQSYSYVPCSQDSECSLDWKCGGPCAAF